MPVGLFQCASNRPVNDLLALSVRSNDAQDAVSTTSVALKALLYQDTVADIAEDTIVAVSRIRSLADLAQAFHERGPGLTSGARFYSLRTSEQVGQAAAMAALKS